MIREGIESRESLGQGFGSKPLLNTLTLIFFLGSVLYADDHFGHPPPVPKITILHDSLNGKIEVIWISDSTFDRPIWYIVEVKQVDDNNQPDPQFLWYRPIIPIQSNFNELITIRMSYKNNEGLVHEWARAEMFRIRAMWGA